MFNVDQVLGYAYDPIEYTYTERDVALYALGVGAPANPLDGDELKFVYELSGAFAALPTFPVIFPTRMIDVLLSGQLAGMTFNPMMLVHGEQSLTLHAPIPTRGTITCRPVIRAVYDKGSGALVVTDVPCADAEGTLIATIESSMFIRGLGGFGGERGPASDADAPPERAPDAVMTEMTSPHQALIYRLSGDINPLHADPGMAAMGGFDKPILHGLCTYGYAGRAVLKHFCDNDPARFGGMKARFAKPVFPGDAVQTEMWREGNRVLLRCTVPARDAMVLTHGSVQVG